MCTTIVALSVSTKGQAASASMEPLRFMRGRPPLLWETDTSVGIEDGGEEELDDEVDSFLILIAPWRAIAASILDRADLRSDSVQSPIFSSADADEDAGALEAARAAADIMSELVKNGPEREGTPSCVEEPVLRVFSPLKVSSIVVVGVCRRVV